MNLESKKDKVFFGRKHLCKVIEVPVIIRRVLDRGVILVFLPGT